MFFYLLTVVSIFIFPACVTSLGVSPRHWPLVSLVKRDNNTEQCSSKSDNSTKREIGLVGPQYGRTNNFLKSISHIAVLARQNPGTICLRLTSSKLVSDYLRYYEITQAVRSTGAYRCSDDQVCSANKDEIIGIANKQDFFIGTDRDTFNKTKLQKQYSSALINAEMPSYLLNELRIAILLHPKKEVIDRAEYVIKKLGLRDGSRTGYIGIHLRWEEGSCHRRSGGYGPWCSMDDDYLNAELMKFPNYAKRKPVLFLAHDSQQKKRVTELEKRFNVVTSSNYVDGEIGVVVDTYLLARSTLFIGSPPSTVSESVCVVREYINSKYEGKPHVEKSRCNIFTKTMDGGEQILDPAFPIK